MSDTGHGGAREGAGRKAKPDKFKVPIAKAEKKIADKLPTLIDKAIELAEGVLVEDFNIVTMQTTVYQKPPDLGAIKYLVDRIMGKPTERREISGPDNGPIEIADARNQLATVLSRTLEDRNASGATGSDTSTPAADSGGAAH